MNKTFNKIFFVIFVIMWLGLTIGNIVAPKKKYSENENRYLNDVPKFSVETLLNGKYALGIEASINDHFILRDQWISTQSILEYGIGKRESNNVYIADNALMSKLSITDDKNINTNIDGIKHFADTTKIPTYTMIIPSAASIQSYKLPKFATPIDEKKIISDINNNLNNSISVYNTLYENKDKYIYYRTDHHWTTYGSYLAYVEYCKALNLTPIKYSAKKLTDNFNGTLFSSSGVRFVDSDTIEAYYSENFNGCEVFDGVKTTSYDSIYFNDFLNQKDKYAFFLGQNQPLVRIFGKNNTGKKLIIFKDSYAHCMAPMLLEHYDEIALIDLRYIMTDDLNKIVNINDYNDALFLYSLDTFSTQSNVGNLKYIVK